MDDFIERTLPHILADRELGDGRTFTQLHLRHLWALLCLENGECCDEEVLAQHVFNYLPHGLRIQYDR
jgi:hypothetical protein